MQQQIFIKNPPAISALQKNFLSCKTKMKSVDKIMKQTLSSPITAVHTVNNKISKILQKHPRRGPLPTKQQAYSLQLYWKCLPKIE